MDFDNRNDIFEEIDEKKGLFSIESKFTLIVWIKLILLLIFFLIGYYLKKIAFLVFLKRKKIAIDEIKSCIHEEKTIKEEKEDNNLNLKNEMKKGKENHNVIEDDKFIKIPKNIDINSSQSIKEIKVDKLKANSIDEKELLNSNYNADVNTINDNIEEEKDNNKDKEQNENNEINSKESDNLYAIEELSDDEEYVIGSIYNYNIAYTNYKLKKTLETTSHLTNTITIIDSLDKSNNTNSNEEKKSDPVSTVIKSEVKEKNEVKSNKIEISKKGITEENKKKKNVNLNQPKKGKANPVSFKTFFNSNSEDLIQLYFVRVDLGMGMGKIGAQVAHSSIWIFDKVFEDNNKHSQEQFIEWETTHRKMFFTIDSVDKFSLLRTILIKKGILFVIISDAGHTQIKAGSKTVLCIQPLKEKEILEKINVDINTYLI